MINFTVGFMMAITIFACAAWIYIIVSGLTVLFGWLFEHGFKQGLLRISFIFAGLALLWGLGALTCGV